MQVAKMCSRKLYLTAAALAAVAALMVVKTDAFSLTLPSRTRRRPHLSANPRDGENEEPDTEIEHPSLSENPGVFDQEELTRAREAESIPGENDFCAGTTRFDMPISVQNSYGDDVAAAVRHLPAAFDQCKQLEGTFFGDDYIKIRYPIYVLASTKLEGILNKGASEGDTYKFLEELVEAHSKSGINIIPAEKSDDIEPWEEDGNNRSNRAAWFAQCRSHLRALTMMMNWGLAGESLTPERLLACHHELMMGATTQEGTIFESKYRQMNEKVHADLHVFPTLNHEKEMGAILEQAESEFGKVHPVQYSCNLLYRILVDHPFLNGNGRMARLCFAYGLARHGVACPIVFSDWHSKARDHYLFTVKQADGQQMGKRVEPLYSMGIIALFNTLNDMSSYCALSKKE